LYRLPDRYFRLRTLRDLRPTRSLETPPRTTHSRRPLRGAARCVCVDGRIVILNRYFRAKESVRSQCFVSVGLGKLAWALLMRCLERNGSSPAGRSAFLSRAKCPQHAATTSLFSVFYFVSFQQFLTRRQASMKAGAPLKARCRSRPSLARDMRRLARCP
jgi:hypothetical protein